MIMGYRKSTPLNVILGESKIPPPSLRNDFLYKSFLSRAYTAGRHEVIHNLEEVQEILQDPTRAPQIMSFPIINSFVVVSNISRFLNSFPTISCFSVRL